MSCIELSSMHIDVINTGSCLTVLICHFISLTCFGAFCPRDESKEVCVHNYHKIRDDTCCVLTTIIAAVEGHG